ncbi:hypothetical protein SASPL_123116 [Salvia splendens]|uniref:PGG domain-containing protein n=1 Tax=Salvia splendens TaxID=180675 RepID=A0A8X8XMV1_SALSN|nr:ankyrin repeat-containing protein At5g02620-like [Salvia splendens]KAG6415702.1 hypothetical protein SASPL_123116 [Salvia splendens]
MEQAYLNHMFHRVALTGDTSTLDSLLSNERVYEAVLSQNVLHFAAFYGYEDLVRALFRRFPTLERLKASTLIKSLPLHLAAEKGHLNICKWLIEAYPAACTESNANGMNPLHLAAQEGHHLVCGELLDKCPVACIGLNSLGMNPLHIVVLKGNLDVLRQLLNNSFTNMVVKQRLPQGQTILHACVASDQLDSLWVLAEKPFLWSGLRGAKDDDGNTMLHIVVANTQHEIFEYLVSENNVACLSKNKIGKSELDLAGDNNEMKLVLSHLVPVRYVFVGIAMDMVFAIPLATLAYQTTASPPGGVWQDATSYHTPGEPILLHT